MTTTQQPGRSGRRVVWAAGLIVATGAGVATAHGLFQVAAAARVPAGIAWLYPLITDGLALVAYAATARLHDAGRRYAATIVVLAAGLSGLAQATYLTGSLAGSATAAPAVLRFGVGAWPAIAAALTAHLLHLIGTDPSATSDETPRGEVSTAASVQSYSPPPRASYSPASNAEAVQPQRSAERPDPAAVQPPRTADPPAARPADLDRSAPAASPPPRAAAGREPVRDRARAAARSYYARHDRLPTVTELMRLAEVARGTAGTVLKDLRDNRPALHVVNDRPENRTNQ